MNGFEYQSPPARLLVYERTGRWARALIRAAPELGTRTRQLRSLDECWSQISDAPASVLGLECGAANLDALWAMVLKVDRRYCHVQLLIFLDRSLADLEPAFREAGALDVAYTLADALRFANLAARQLSRFPVADKSLRDEIWNKLPWNPGKDDAQEQ